jgi:hypothetical protein
MEKIPESIAKKLFAAQGKLVWVEKTGVNISQKYSYTRAEDLISAVKRACQEVGLSVIVSNGNPTWEIVEKERANGNKGWDSYWRLLANVILVDSETGDVWQVPGEFAGEGVDSGDKAPYKAQTGAKKYALMGVFGIAMGDDPEDDSDEDTRVESKGGTHIFANIGELKTYLATQKRTEDLKRVDMLVKAHKGLTEIAKELGL